MYFVGFDGGGTKTECLLLDARGNLVGRGLAGPSNANRIGFETAFQNLREAADQALSAGRVDARQVSAVCAGLAGAGSRRVVKRAMGFLVEVFSQATVHVTTDALVALEAAAGQGPGVILISGTGSVCMGRNASGQTARSGGMGPWISDEGSAFDIGRRGVLAVSLAREARGPVTLLSEMIPPALELSAWESLIEQIARMPDQVFPLIFPLVVEAADQGDDPACEILFSAAMALSGVAAAVIRRLDLEDEKFVLAKSGGVFGHSKLFDNALDALLQGAARKAQLRRLEIAPALGAARWAMRLGAGQAKVLHGAKA